MEWYWILGIVLLVAAVALAVYAFTRPPTQTGFFAGFGAGSSGTSIGNSIGGIFSSLGPVASSIGTAVDSGRTPPVQASPV